MKTDCRQVVVTVVSVISNAAIQIDRWREREREVAFLQSRHVAFLGPSLPAVDSLLAALVKQGI